MSDLFSLVLLAALLAPVAFWTYAICTPYYSTHIPGIPKITEKAGPLGDLLPTLAFYWQRLEFHP